MATAEASTCGEKRKEVVVSFMTSDSPYDASENTKMKILLTTSMSSSRGKVISFVDYEDKTEFMTLKPREISTIVEQGGKKYLCLEYGPKRKAKFILLAFTDESRENLDEWNVFLCRMMGLESKPPRSKTVNDKIIHRRKMNPVLRTISAFLPTYTPIFGPVNSGEAPNSPDGVLEPPSSGTASGEAPNSPDGVLEPPSSGTASGEAPKSPDGLLEPPFSGTASGEAPNSPDGVLEPPSSGTASGEAPNSPDGVLKPPSSSTASGSESPEISDGDSTSGLSPFSSLKSTEPDNSLTDIKYDFPKDLLNQHQFKKYQDEIVVTQSVPGSELHVGNTIALRTDEGTTGEGTSPKNTEDFREYIRKTKAPKIMLAYARGVEIKMKDGDQELTINISGPKTQRPDAVEAALKACNQSRLAIAEINGAPIPVGTQEDQVAQKLREALGGSTECHLHLIPRSLMTAESDVEVLDDEVLDDEEPDIVQDAWPINVEGNSSVSGNTNATGNEETEC